MNAFFFLSPLITMIGQALDREEQMPRLVVTLSLPPLADERHQPYRKVACRIIELRQRHWQRLTRWPVALLPLQFVVALVASTLQPNAELVAVTRAEWM